MPRPACEIADVFRRYGAAFQAQYGRLLGPLHLLVLKALAACRTAQLGGHVLECDPAGIRSRPTTPATIATARSARPACGAQWFEDRQRDLLPVEYFHVVFTLPDELGPLALQNKAVIYNLLFRAASRNAARGGRRLEGSSRPRSASSPSCTRGAKNSICIRICIASSRRRDLARRHAVGQLPARLLHAGQTAQPNVPRQVSGVSQSRPIVAES